MEIYRRGHRDYVDALHYATAKAISIPWLTIDETFIDFLKESGYPIQRIVLTPKELRELVH